MSTTEKSPEFYTHYPALLYTYFPIVSKETIKILTSIYGYKSPFWGLWQQRKAEYFKAIHTEKRLLTTPMVSFEQYSSLADDKSAFGKIAIDSLWIQSNTLTE